MELVFGKEQIYASRKMQSSPRIGKLVHKIFGYTNIGNYARFTIFNRILKSLPTQEFNKVLDLGCGYGEFSFAMARALKNSSIHALDISEERTNRVKEVIQKEAVDNIHVHHAFIENMDESSFDFIFSIDVFEHIDPKEMPFKDVYSKLRQGGYALIKIPNWRQWTIFPDSWFEEHNHWLDDEHIGQIYDAKGLAKRFVQEGFEVIAAESTDGVLSRFAWELGYLAKKAGIITHLMALPICKAFIHLDRIVHRGEKGNAIHVIARKK